MAERGADDPDADLVGFRRIDDDLLDGEWLAGGSAYRRCVFGARPAPSEVTSKVSRG